MIDTQIVETQSKDDTIRELNIEIEQLKQTVKKLQYENNLKKFDTFIEKNKMKNKMKNKEIDCLLSQNKLLHLKRIYLDFYNTVKDI